MGVYKEGKNWKVQVYYKDWQGNRKRKQKRGFRTKGEAKEWERDFLQQQSQGVDIEFGNFLEIYYKDMDVRLRENTTARSGDDTIRRIIMIPTSGFPDDRESAAVNSVVKDRACRTLKDMQLLLKNL